VAKEKKMGKRSFFGVMTAALLAGALVLSCEFDGEGPPLEKNIYIYNVNDPVVMGDCFIDVVRHAQWETEVTPDVIVATARKAGRPSTFANGRFGPVALLDVKQSMADPDNPIPWTGEGEYFVILNSLSYAHRITKYKQPFYYRTLHLNYPKADFVEPLQAAVLDWNPEAYPLEGIAPYYFRFELYPASTGDIANTRIAFAEIPSEMVLGGNEAYPSFYKCEGTYFVAQEDDGTLYIYSQDDMYCIHFVQTDEDGNELKRWKYSSFVQVLGYEMTELEGNTPEDENACWEEATL
jgi:hypothetical protein